MADTNAQAKSLLLDTQLIVTNKFTVFASDDAVDKTKLETLQKKADEQIQQFKQPEVWLKQVEIDRTKVFSCLLAINEVSVPQIDDLTAQVDVLIVILQEALVNSADNADAGRSDKTEAGPNRNQEALEGLQNIRRKTLGRFQFFMARGIDLATNADFQELRKRQVPLRDNYTKKLRDESVLADEIDVMLLNGFADAFQASEELAPFFKHYGELSDFIEQRCPLPTA
ncbi:MAG: hypothetical protein ACRBG0_25060 [Lewinella sp.]|jgi:hypothetical protein|uniref:hypothetical protein n=1 Tax=Lewinella sp. TaxID=2004506 RepID=UPI003D6A72D1